MPRYRQLEKLNDLQIEEIAHRAGLLRNALDEALRQVEPMEERYLAVLELRKATYRCEAIPRGEDPKLFGAPQNSTPA